MGNDRAPLQERNQGVSDEVFSDQCRSWRRSFKIGAAFIGLGLAVCACFREAFSDTMRSAGPSGVDLRQKSEVFHVFTTPKKKSLADADAQLHGRLHTFQLPTRAPPKVHTFEMPHETVHKLDAPESIHTFTLAPPVHTFSTPPVHTFSQPKEGGHTTNKKLPWWKKNARPGEAWPSLFCWMHMENSELKLVQSQLQGKFGIFNCNDFAVVTRDDKQIELGPHPTKAGKSVLTWPNPMAPDVRGNPKLGDQTDSWMNANTFKVAWQTLIDSGSLWKHDWIVKIDPDTVFFADRLRYHVLNKTMPPEGPGKFFFLNCLYGDGRIYGAIEVYSVRAILNFKANGSKCNDLDTAVMGEDLFMEQCMRILQGSNGAIKDFKLVGDAHCTQTGCMDAWRVGFHPFPKVEDYWDCANTAVEAAAPAKK